MIICLHPSYDDCTQIVIALSWDHHNEIARIQNVLATRLKSSMIIQEQCES
jgi:hypothetical protein